MNKLKKKDKEERVSYVFKNINRLSRDDKISLLEQVYIITPGCLYDSTSTDSDLCLDTDLLNDDVLIFIYDYIKKIIN